MVAVALMTTLVGLGSFPVVRQHAIPVEVVSQQGASPAEIHAAEELATYLGRVVGISVPVIRDATNAPDYSIIVGDGPATKRRFRTVNAHKLASEEILMKSQGRRLLLMGGSPRGTLYAVYKWLGDAAGVRWWSPWASSVPAHPDFTISRVDRQERPRFELRDPYWFGAFNGDWAARNFTNGFGERLDSTRGGKWNYGGFVHTAYVLVPPEKYFAIHPEWFAEIKGKRVFENSQLCTTNAQLRDFLVQQVREICKNDPSVNIVSVSQNDNVHPCECAVCRALDDKEGSPQGSNLEMTNYIAAAIAKEYPNVVIDTLAYQYTRKPPKNLRPLPNVVVRLCSIESSFAQPLSDPLNAKFAEDLKSWSRITHRLHIWDYATNFSYLLHPFPNYDVLAANLRFFAQNGVSGVFEEGDYQSNGGDFAELKAWLLARLMWDPDQDEAALRREFLQGYYGAAGEPLGRYLDLMASAARPAWLSINAPATDAYFNYDVMVRAESLWNEAEKKVADQPEMLWRVKASHANLQTVWLINWEKYKAESSKLNDGWPLGIEKSDLAKQWIAQISGPGPAGWTPVTHLSEGGLTPAEFLVAIGQTP